MKVEPSISLADFRRKHQVAKTTCFRWIKEGRLKTTRAANGRQRITASAEQAWLTGKN